MAKIEVDQKQFDQMQTMMAEMQATITALNSRVQDAEKKIPNLASTIDEIAKRNKAAERAPKIVTLKKFSGYTYDKETDTRTEIPLVEGEYKENCCPFCVKEKKPSLLDITMSGRWACRTCGKHWYEEALGQPYSKALEKFIKVGDDDVDPINVFRKDNQANDDKVSKLEAEMAELKTLLIKALAPKLEAPKVDKVA